MRMLLDYSSAFNTIVLSRLDRKFRDLGIDPSLCNWILGFLTDRKQVVKMGSKISAPLTISTGAPQGCVLSPLLYSLYTHDCMATHGSNAVLRLFHLRRLKKFGVGPKILKAFFRGTTESILTGCITAWYGNCTAQSRKMLQRVVRTAERISGCELPSIQETYKARCVKKALPITGDPSHPNQKQFELLPSGRRYRSLRAKTQRIPLSSQAPGETHYPQTIHTHTTTTTVWNLTTYFSVFTLYCICTVFIYCTITLPVAATTTT